MHKNSMEEVYMPLTGFFQYLVIRNKSRLKVCRLYIGVFSVHLRKLLEE